jgi:hypothetical protein
MHSIPYLKSLYTSSDAANFAFYVTSAYTYPGIPLLFLMVWGGHRLPISLRILTSLLLQVAIMVLMPFTAPSSMWAPLALMFINGLCTSVLQSSLFGFARCVRGERRGNERRGHNKTRRPPPSHTVTII